MEFQFFYLINYLFILKVYYVNFRLKGFNLCLNDRIFSFLGFFLLLFNYSEKNKKKFIYK